MEEIVKETIKMIESFGEIDSYEIKEETIDNTKSFINFLSDRGIIVTDNYVEVLHDGNILIDLYDRKNHSLITFEVGSKEIGYTIYGYTEIKDIEGKFVLQSEIPNNIEQVLKTYKTNNGIV